MPTPAASELLYLLTIFPFKFNSAAFCTEDYLKAKFDILNPATSELSENRKGTGINAWSINSGSARGNRDGSVSFPEDPAGLRAVGSPMSRTVLNSPFGSQSPCLFWLSFKKLPADKLRGHWNCWEDIIFQKELSWRNWGNLRCQGTSASVCFAGSCHEPSEVWARKKMRKKQPMEMIQTYRNCYISSGLTEHLQCSRHGALC